MNSSRLLLICAVIFSLCGTSFGAIVERTAQLDLATLSLPTSDLKTVVAVDPFSADVNDTLILHLDFVGGRLGIRDTATSGADYLGLQFLSSPLGQTGFLYTGTWHFEDVIGDLLLNDFSLQYGGPLGGFTDNKNLTDSMFSIGGLTYTIAITSKEAGRPPFTSELVEVRAFTAGQANDSIFLQAVPEPTTALLVMLGLVCVVATKRRRHTFTA